MWIQREIRRTLEQTAASRPVVVLTGARQAGKTSLLQQAFPQYNYVSLDLPIVAEQAESAGQAFLEEYPPPVIVDEVQYAPELFRYLKHAVDSQNKVAGQFLLTGSQKFTLMQGVSESLAGRASLIELHSLSLLEIESSFEPIQARSDLLNAMHRGSYPELWAKDLAPDRYFSDYVATYLERDVRQVLNVRNLRDFDRFLRLCSVRTGQLVNFNALATDVGVSVNTIKSWLSVLEASNVVYLLPPYFRNLGKRVVKSPKLYFLDTGLCSYLAGFRSASDLKNSSLLGAFFETLVIGQMVRAYANRGLAPTLYFYRDHHGHEVDVVVPVGERAHLLECKWTETGQASKSLDVVARAFGGDQVKSRTLVTPVRGLAVSRASVRCTGPVDFGWLLDE